MQTHWTTIAITKVACNRVLPVIDIGPLGTVNQLIFLSIPFILKSLCSLHLFSNSSYSLQKIAYGLISLLIHT